MDLPSHVLYTYAVEKVSLPYYLIDKPGLITASLIFSAAPDVLESVPFLIYLYLNKKRLNLKNIKEVVSFAVEITHNRPMEYENKFKWASRISFYSHSYLVYVLLALIIYFYVNWSFLPFVIGYGLHLFTDILAHNDYFSSRPLYPLSNFKIPGLFTWYKEKKFIRYNYAILAVVYVFIIVTYNYRSVWAVLGVI